MPLIKDGFSLSVIKDDFSLSEHTYNEVNKLIYNEVNKQTLKWCLQYFENGRQYIIQSGFEGKMADVPP